MNRYGTAIVLILVPLWCCVGGDASGLSASYLYRLSDVTGAIPSSWATVRGDDAAHEVYVHNPSDKTIRIFNESGMEIYRFGDDLKAVVLDLSITADGSILLLIMRQKEIRILKSSFRGEPLAEFALQGVPEAFGPFVPNLLLGVDANLFLVDRNGMKIGVFNQQGQFVEGIDLGNKLGLLPEQVMNSGLGGFAVRGAHTYLFTIPVFFKAYVYDHGTIRSFGTRGSSPGKFNVLAGIDTDNRGNIFIVDTLRCVVMVFDESFSFLAEFGYRGHGPGNLIIPRDVNIQDDRVYVTEGGDRGVSVFKISYQ
jgi:hypothetical protein